MSQEKQCSDIPTTDVITTVIVSEKTLKVNVVIEPITNGLISTDSNGKKVFYNDIKQLFDVELSEIIRNMDDDYKHSVQDGTSTRIRIIIEDLPNEFKRKE